MNPGAIAKNIEFRLPLHGRIRTGTKTSKGYPTKLQTFRLTSSDRNAIEEVATAYGGEVKAWENQHNPEWEVITQVKEMDVILPPDPLAGPTWEFWTKGGLQFSCDGEMCEKRVTTPDGPDWDEVPCLCKENKQAVCKPKTRLKVLLPDVSLGGSWMLTTGSLYAAMELPSMVRLVNMVYSATLTPARLVLEARTSVSNGETKKYNVPLLRTRQSITELQASEKLLGLPAVQLATKLAELEASTDIVEGEIVDE